MTGHQFKSRLNEGTIKYILLGFMLCFLLDNSL